LDQKEHIYLVSPQLVEEKLSKTVNIPGDIGLTCRFGLFCGLDGRSSILSLYTGTSGLATKYLPPEKVQSIVSEVCMFCATRGNNHPLDMALMSLRKAIEFKEAQDYLKSP
jgi:hypothetical protein